MDRSRLIELFNRDQRQQVEYPSSRREVVPGIVRLVALEQGGKGTVIYSDLDGADVEAVIGEQVAYFEQLGQAFEWKVFDFDRPPDLKERLARHGFEVGEEEALLVLDLQQAPARLLQPVAQDIRRVTSSEELDDVIGVEEAVWGEAMDDLRSYLASGLESEPERLSIYMAYEAGVAASAAWIYFPRSSQFASLWGGSTLAAYRGRGLYSALLAVRLQEALARGARYLAVDASPMSRPLLEKRGFELIGFTYECVWEGGQGRE